MSNDGMKVGDDIHQWVQKYLEETKRAVEEVFSEKKTDGKTFKRAIAGLKTLISSSFHFDETISKEIVNSASLEETQLPDFIAQADREEAMESLIKMSKKYPKKTYELLKYRVPPMDIEKIISDFRQVIGDKQVDQFLKLVESLKEEKKRIVFLNATFYGGGVSEMLEAGVPLLHHLGLNVQWHTIWSPIPAFFSTTKRIHNIIQGVNDLEPDWELFEKVSQKNIELYDNLKKPLTSDEDPNNIHFFFDDPQLAGMNMDKRDIAVLHVDTGGVDHENEQSITAWNHLKCNWEKARYFLHQQGHSGGKHRLSNDKILHPGTNVLSKKSMPRSSVEEAFRNIRSKELLDDDKRKPMIEEGGSIFMFVGRADPAKGQLRGLLAFSNYLHRDPSSHFLFFIQFAPDDPEGLAQYLTLKLIIEEREKNRNLLKQKLKKAFENMENDGFDEQNRLVDKLFEKTKERLPEGVSSLRERVQIFINLSDEIGDFAKISTAHLILSTREGYNMVISELAKQKLPVIANDLPPFHDRIKSGKRGGWLISNHEEVIAMQEVDFLNGYLNNDKKVIKYLNDIVDTMERIKNYPVESKKVVEELDEWINHNGNILCHLIGRLELLSKDA